jgi:hypothetical protein
MAFLAVVSPRRGFHRDDLRRNGVYQLLFVMPGNSPRCAISRRQMRQMPNFLYTECDRPHLLHRVYPRTLNFGFAAALIFSAFFAISSP